MDTSPAVAAAGRRTRPARAVTLVLVAGLAVAPVAGCAALRVESGPLVTPSADAAEEARQRQAVGAARVLRRRGGGRPASDDGRRHAIADVRCGGSQRTARRARWGVGALPGADRPPSPAATGTPTAVPGPGTTLDVLAEESGVGPRRAATVSDGRLAGYFASMASTVARRPGSRAEERDPPAAAGPSTPSRSRSGLSAVALGTGDRVGGRARAGLGGDRRTLVGRGPRLGGGASPRSTATGRGDLGRGHGGGRDGARPAARASYDLADRPCSTPRPAPGSDWRPGRPGGRARRAVVGPRSRGRARHAGTADRRVRRRRQRAAGAQRNGAGVAGACRKRPETGRPPRSGLQRLATSPPIRAAASLNGTARPAGAHPAPGPRPPDGAAGTSTTPVGQAAADGDDDRHAEQLRVGELHAGRDLGRSS